MSLLQGYSSDEDDTSISAANDAFGLSSLPTAKKARIDEASGSGSEVTIKPLAAPDVLAEVRPPVIPFHGVLNLYQPYRTP